MTKLSELKTGDKVRVTGFTCLADGDHCEVRADGERLYVYCQKGQHFLDGQEDEPGADLVGVTRIIEAIDD